MRRPVGLLVFGLVLGGLAGGGFAQERKRGKREQAIKVVKLDRKVPVSYDKEVEPILKDKCMVCHSGTVTEG